MNRAERRWKMKASKKPAPIYNPNPIEQAVKREAQKEYEKQRQEYLKHQKEQRIAASEIALAMLFSIPIKVLHDKYGWRSRKRLPEFARALEEEYQRFRDGDMELDEYVEEVFKMTGIKFQVPED